MRQTTFGSLTVVALTILASTSTAQLKDKNAAVAAAIRSAGFDCKRVYGVAPLNGSPYGEGLSVGCDSTVPGIRYVFRMVDHGGRWLVTPVQRLQNAR